jgi:hypothetical protein
MRIAVTTRNRMFRKVVVPGDARLHHMGMAIFGDEPEDANSSSTIHPALHGVVLGERREAL